MKGFMKTISYPNRRQVINLTITVAVTITVASLFIFGVDAIIMNLYNLII